MLEEYLAAKRRRAPLKERASRPPDPASTGPGAALRRGTTAPPAQTPSGPAPCASALRAPLLLRSQADSKGQKKAPAAPKAVAPHKGPPGRPGGRGPSERPGQREGATGPSHAHRRPSGHGCCRKQATGGPRSEEDGGHIEPPARPPGPCKGEQAGPGKQGPGGQPSTAGTGPCPADPGQTQGIGPPWLSGALPSAQPAHGRLQKSHQRPQSQQDPTIWSL